MRSSFLIALVLSVSTFTDVLAAKTSANDLQPLGSTCTASSQCASLYCAEEIGYYGDEGYQTCQAAPAGHSCTADQYCATQKCTSGACARAQDGAVCGFDSDCLSHRCDGTDGNGYAYNDNPSCAKSVGGTCSTGNDCGSDGCDRGLCGKSDKDSRCAKDSDCLSGSTCSVPSGACDRQDVNCVGIGSCTISPNGSPCRYDSGCTSGRCGPSDSATGLGICIDRTNAPAKARPRQTCYTNNDCLYQTAPPICAYPNNDPTKTGTCSPQGPFDKCKKDNDCRNFNCNTKKGQCAMNNIGEFCVIDYDCFFVLKCNKGKCDPNDDCYSENQCLPNFTCVRDNDNTGHGICHKRTSVNKADGEACKHDYQCVSRNCDNAKCAKKA